MNTALPASIKLIFVSEEVFQLPIKGQLTAEECWNCFEDKSEIPSENKAVVF